MLHFHSGENLPRWEGEISFPRLTDNKSANNSFSQQDSTDKSESSVIRTASLLLTCSQQHWQFTSLSLNQAALHREDIDWRHYAAIWRWRAFTTPS